MKRQIIKYLIVGGFTTIIYYSVFYILYKIIGTYYLFSSAISFFLAVLFGYVFNKKWTFRTNSKSRMEVVRYYSVYFFSMIITLIIMKIEVDYFRTDPLIANMAVIFIIPFINFLGMKFFVFNEKEKNNYATT